MTPAEVRAAHARVREAGLSLRRRPARETLDALARVFELWRDAGSPWRRELEEKLPAATGFAPPTVREGLAHALGAWSGEALHALVREELGSLGPEAEPRVSGFASAALVLAGALPTPTLLALLAPLVLRTPVVAKTAAADPVTAPLVARSVADVDAGLGACLEVLGFTSDDADCLDALAEAELVVATGADASVAAMAARVAPPRRFVGYGHRLSVATLGAEATRGQALAEAAAGLALDVALWDQLGCLSPVAVYVEADRGAPDRVAEALAAALEDAESRWPRGHVPLQAAAQIAAERDEARLRAAAGRRVCVLAAEPSGWTVVREDRCMPRPAPLHRFVRVHPVEGLVGSEGLAEALAPLGPHLAGVALAGFGPRTPQVEGLLAEAGASRLCAPGRLQAPPLRWRRDGLGVLQPLARTTSLERA